MSLTDKVGIWGKSWTFLGKTDEKWAVNILGNSPQDLIPLYNIVVYIILYYFIIFSPRNVVKIIHPVKEIIFPLPFESLNIIFVLL